VKRPYSVKVAVESNGLAQAKSLHYDETKRVTERIGLVRVSAHERDSSVFVAFFRVRSILYGSAPIRSKNVIVPRRLSAPSEKHGEGFDHEKPEEPASIDEDFLHSSSPRLAAAAATYFPSRGP